MIGSFIKKATSAYLIEDGAEANSFTERTIDTQKNKTIEVELKPNGGLVMIVK